MSYRSRSSDRSLFPMRYAERIFVGAIYVFLFLPMAVLTVLSFNTAKRGARWEGFTTDWYFKLLNDAAILEALSLSLEVALYAAVLSGALGLCVGLSLARSTGRGRFTLTRLATLPIVLPEIVQGLSLLAFFVWLAVP
ncbi:MAG: hypothetical protein ABL958_20470, partial [Bdellovibrionia bacterium]